ncbi:hypothetical protein EW026_g2893 [Hermanssonia centrifuga]|uniref:Uncharacterized protein n=2 Tax=Hermanssonia centrifuga TaxID=98765 RepID=A0A4S4KLV9_9APHY|nr:hypothetical protein PHLCEN_2v2419 [Hermanssonia centrifuga]THG99468.1 hypothetical protein EW026_g2893 [Hermanssonia centrifuga]
MQALRLARPRTSFRALNVAGVRSLTATAHSSHASPAPTTVSSVIPLSNVEAQWERLSSEEKLSVHQQLEDIQKKDWKTLSLDEKKAAYYVAFGPHGPRAPIHPPGTGYKIALGVAGLIAASGAIFLAVRSRAPPPPRTITKEWEEASNERALEQKSNPITGISSEGYTGKGFVTHK